MKAYLLFSFAVVVTGNFHSYHEKGFPVINQIVTVLDRKQNEM